MLAALKQTNDFVLSQGKPLDPVSKAAYDDIQGPGERPRAEQIVAHSAQKTDCRLRGTMLY